MARANRNIDAGEGLFGIKELKPSEAMQPPSIKVVESDLEIVSVTPQQIIGNYESAINKIKKSGRPKAADLQKNENTIQTTIYLTKDLQEYIDIYGIKNKMDRSEIVRRLIRKLEAKEIEL